MRARWLKIENKVSEQSIAGGTRDPRVFSIEITMSLSGCGGGRSEFGTKAVEPRQSLSFPAL